jgi:hypothetical protein
MNDTINLRCRGCGLTKDGVWREKFDPPSAVLADVLCPECSVGTKDPETLYYDSDGREVVYRPTPSPEGEEA